jgi:starch synthase
MSNKLKIIHVSPEVAPFSKTGGLADVARSLPKALKRLGHDISIITPLYGKIINKEEERLKLIYKDVEIFLNSKESLKVNFWQGELMEDLPIYFIESKEYFSKSKDMYGFPNENARFLIFSVATLKLISLFKNKPDIIHCHDWQTGLIPYYLKNNFVYAKNLKDVKTIFTIHNLIFQLGHNWWEIPLERRDYGRSRLPHLSDKRLEDINFAKRAILSADLINTVSEQYRSEIMTKRFGQDLHQILRNREERLFGIINGIDYNAYNPEKDPGLIHPYSYKNPGQITESRRKNKLILQNKLNLSENVKVPVLCTTSRLTFQKGFNLILLALKSLLKHDLQVVIMGDGSKDYVNPLKKLMKQFPKKIIWLPFNQTLETSIYAASDIFVLPSNHEPCGINQLIAMRYGSIPVVREIGGLYDTVKNFNPSTGRGLGFTFKSDELLDFYGALIRALETYRYPLIWEQLVIKAMLQSNSWEIPAKKYITLYRHVFKK